MTRQYFCPIASRQAAVDGRPTQPVFAAVALRKDHQWLDHADYWYGGDNRPERLRFVRLTLWLATVAPIPLPFPHLKRHLAFVSLMRPHFFLGYSLPNSFGIVARFSARSSVTKCSSVISRRNAVTTNNNFASQIRPSSPSTAASALSPIDVHQTLSAGSRRLRIPRPISPLLANQPPPIHHPPNRSQRSLSQLFAFACFQQLSLHLHAFRPRNVHRHATEMRRLTRLQQPAFTRTLQRQQTADGRGVHVNPGADFVERETSFFSRSTSVNS